MNGWFIAASAALALFGLWFLWAVWWYMGRPLVIVMAIGAAIGLGRALYRRGL